MGQPVPQGCTLPTAEQPLRVAEFDDLFATAVQRVQRPGPLWLRLHLASGEETEASTRDLLTRESQCCSFFAFDVTSGDGQLIVDVRVPQARSAVLDGVEQRARLLSRSRLSR